MVHSAFDFATKNHYDDYLSGTGIFEYEILYYIPVYKITILINVLTFVFFIGPCYWHFFVTTFNLTVNTAAITGLFYESENELGNANDYKLLCDQMAVLCATVLTTVMLLYRYPKYVSCPMVFSTITWSIYVLTIPAVVMSLFGAYFLNYLKGDANSGSNIKNSVFDFANLFGFVKRFAIQMLRYVLVTAKVGLFLIFLEAELRATRKLFIIDCEERFKDTYVEWMLDNIQMLFYDIIHCFVELANVFIVYYSQLGAFVIILYWLLNSLFSNSWPIVKLLWLRKE